MEPWSQSCLLEQRPHTVQHILSWTPEMQGLTIASVAAGHLALVVSIATVASIAANIDSGRGGLGRLGLLVA